MSNPLLARRFGLDMVGDHDHPDSGQVLVDFSVGPYPQGAALGVGAGLKRPSYALSEWGQQLVFNKIFQHTVFQPIVLEPGRWTINVGTQFMRAPENFFWTGIELRLDPPHDNAPGPLLLDILSPNGTSFAAPILRRNGDALTGGEMLAGTYNTLLFYLGAWRVVTVFNAEVGGTGRSAIQHNGATIVPAANVINFLGVNIDVQSADGGTTANVTVSMGDGDAGGGGGPGGPVDWNSIDGKPSTFPPDSHTHAWGEISSKPNVIVSLASLATDGILDKNGDVISTVTTTAYGKSLLGVADAASLRIALGVPNANDFLRKDQNFADVLNVSVARFNLGLGAAALLPVNVNGGVPTINGGKISPSLIDVNLELPRIMVETEAQRLLLDANTPLGSLVIQKVPAGRFFAGAHPLSNPDNWTEVTNGDLVLSVFGLTGVIDIVDLPVLPPASLDAADFFVLYDVSTSGHKRVTLQGLKDALGVGASVAGDEAKGVNVTQVSGVAIVGLKTDELPVQTPDVATSAVVFVTGKPDGTPGQMPITALPGALPLKANAILDTDSLALAPLSGPGAKASIANLFTGRTLRGSSVADHDEEYLELGNRTGTLVLVPGFNMYKLRLVGPLTLTLPDDRPAAGSLWRAITLVINQDGVGNRTCAFNPPPGQTLAWPNGTQPPLSALVNGRSRFVFTYIAGELVIDGVRTF